MWKKYKIISKYNQTFNIGLCALLCIILFESLYFFVEIPQGGIVFSRLNLLIKDIIGVSCIIVFYSCFQSRWQSPFKPCSRNLIKELFRFICTRSLWITWYFIGYSNMEGGYGRVGLYWMRFFLTFLGHCSCHGW